LEVSVNQMLANGGDWPFGAAVTCSPRISVELDERVLEQIRTYSEQRIRMDCEHEEGVRRAELADRLSRRWVKVLEGLLESPVAGGAARLTEQRLAEVVDGLLVAQGNVTDGRRSCRTNRWAASNGRRLTTGSWTTSACAPSSPGPRRTATTAAPREQGHRHASIPAGADAQMWGWARVNGGAEVRGFSG
jgi:hypothetical protein